MNPFAPRKSNNRSSNVPQGRQQVRHEIRRKDQIGERAQRQQLGLDPHPRVLEQAPEQPEEAGQVLHQPQQPPGSEAQEVGERAEADHGVSRGRMVSAGAGTRR